MKEIRLYIEGGGDSRSQYRTLGRGFAQFFAKPIEMARSRKIQWNTVLCGGRRFAYEDFKTSLRQNRDSFTILLVDAEESVVEPSPWEHLRLRKDDSWLNPGVSDEHCHLMVQTIESWLMADLDALEAFYGQGFTRNSFPRNSNVESILKDDIRVALRDATRRTRKGSYRKIQHCSELLGKIDVSKVRARAHHCDRLFTTIENLIQRH